MTATGDLAQSRLALALHAGRVGTWHWDRATGAVEWDAAMESVFGLPASSFGGSFEHWIQLVHPDDVQDVVAAVRQGIEHGDAYSIEHRIVHPDGAVRWLECRGEAVADETGRITGMVGVGLDVTDRRQLQARQERLQVEHEHARRRLAFLAEASDVLARSLDLEASLDELANLAVRRLSDWASVNLLDGANLRTVTIAHADPAKVELARQLLERYGRPSKHASLKVLRTRRPEVLESVSDELLRSIATDEEHLELLRGLGMGSLVVVPLQARGALLGTLALVRGVDSPPFKADDITLSWDLARRASIAIDNTRLYEEQRRLASALQQTLLPPDLPSIPGVDIAARYEPATTGTSISGDFYDVFDNTHGSWTVLVGDVRGKGPEAAGLTGLSRHTVRAAALRDPDPTQVLAVLNDALIQHDPIESFCTAVCCELEAKQGAVRLRIAGGGHPSALVLRADGKVDSLASTGMLLGLFGEADCQSATVDLAPGETLVLYTDGITEARRGDELFGDQRLAELLARAPDARADRVADWVLHAVREFQDHHRSDDIALLALTHQPAGR